MTIRVALEHLTTYEFDRAVELGPHIVRLRPAPHCRTPIDSYSMRVDPADHFLNWQQDPFGNFQARLGFPELATRLEVRVDLIADMTVLNPFDFFLDEQSEHVPVHYSGEQLRDLAPYLEIEQAGPLLDKWMDGVPPQPADAEDPTRTIDFLVAVNQRLCEAIEYSIRMEPGVQAPDLTLERGIGSCRDSAWLLVQIFRRLGIAARFVSGYLVQLVADIEALDGPSGPTEDFTDLHAWTEVYLPGAGWVGLDPTSGLFAGEGHIPLAATPTPSTAAPISGALGDCEVTFSHSNTVVRISEDPRVTMPFSDEAWESIDALGRRVDERLETGNVQLTMGGEPTYVSIDEFEADEWSTDADGDHKRDLASELTAKLRDRFAKGGLVHHGQGKWYPGEPLPRWQHTLVWRDDGSSIWGDPALLADPEETAPSAAAGVDEAFITALADRLGVGADAVHPTYEDVFHARWQAVLDPVGEPPADDIEPDVDPASIGVDEEDPGTPTGWVLPIRPSESGPRQWLTTEWVTRRGRLVLVPGDSPMGYRLPLDSLGWTPPDPAMEPSNFADPEPFEDSSGASKPGRSEGGADDEGNHGDGNHDEEVDEEEEEEKVPRTALCAEVRDGHLRIFLPPLESAPRALELVGHLEAVASELGQPVVLEGYQIPHDQRLRTLAVTPDPGVIEVNVPPARDWTELRTILEGVDTDARLCRLGTEKFDQDGTHTGTGGGAHLTLGGRTADVSPLLRRPSLLRSLITYWQHHPSLSYLFSGRFIGPSSQAPRVDEARDDSLYELEIAFAEMDRRGDDVPPWMVDRLLRNLLTDLTGNTHRAEFCIDKLYDPIGERGRLGLLELRGFEMPPHVRLALLQALLVRSLVLRCWEDPYRHDPIRWGTDLHDRHLLPWFVEQDLAAVLADLANHDLDFDPEWFGAFTEFRFPRHGTVTVDGVTIELRGAIEPWHVLGEEAVQGGTARYVDSSVERLQVKVEGLVPGRHLVTCNGATLPLTATDVTGVSIAGVRYKAWQPPSGLHPTIGIHSPLTFDLFDVVNERSLGGCRYHVVHPGGRSHDDMPVNASAAEARRQRRFEAQGHTPGPVGRPDSSHLRQHREYPVTLDLRRLAGSGEGGVTQGG